MKNPAAHQTWPHDEGPDDASKFESICGSTAGAGTGDQVRRNVDHEFSVIAVPMHGQHKLSAEGYRTRDGHFIEWLGIKLGELGPVAVVSRPEPLPLHLLNTRRIRDVAQNTVSIRRSSMRLPNLRDRRAWWVKSLPDYPRIFESSSAPAIVWNPFIALSKPGLKLDANGRAIVFDILDDWTVHYAFESIQRDVDRAYRAMFDVATSVTTNSEATLELAQRYGRTDAILLTNGCDPHKFSTTSIASGRTKVGYVGKIGKRVDLELVMSAARALPDIDFVIAGPVLDAEYKKPLASLPNITLLGDVHYRDVPALLTTLDIGWVPHRVGKGEVGGDVIKTYEYRAAGLPVLTTPVLGAADRGLDCVHSLEASAHIGWMREMSKPGPRVPRVIGSIPIGATWEHKIDRVLGELRIGQRSAGGGRDA